MQDKKIQNLILLGILCLTGCTGMVNMFIGGGRLIEPSKEQYKIVAAYGPRHPGVSDTIYQLVEIQGHLAILEACKSENSYMLLETHWKDAKGDHFAAWAKGETAECFAMEILVPYDRQQNALRYAYPYGQYDILEIGGVLRPIPKRNYKAEPDKLISVKITN